MSNNTVKFKGTKEYLLVYCVLIHAARNKALVSYSEIAELMKLPPTGNFMQRQIGALLGEIAKEEIVNGRPMLSALAKSKNKPRPGEGFFNLAKELGIYKGNSEDDEKHFWENLREKIYTAWEE